MSAAPNSFPSRSYGLPPPANDVLGELLHSMSQPLTGLRCSLELSLELSSGLSQEPACGNSVRFSPGQIAEQQQEKVAAALEQTEKVIGMVRLMREYLDAEQFGPSALSSFAPAVSNVCEELSSIAAVRGARIDVVGRCSAMVPVAPSQLRLALQYLLTSVIESQPKGGIMTLRLADNLAGAELHAQGVAFTDTHVNSSDPASPAGVPSTLGKVRLAIARRILETAGASLEFGDLGSEFVLRFPPRFSVAAEK